MTGEHRRSQRQRTFKGVAISFASAPSIECIIRNLSETGACLEVPGSVVPDSFTLIIKPELLKRTCQVVWRTDRRIGELYCAQIQRVGNTRIEMKSPIKPIF